VLADAAAAAVFALAPLPLVLANTAAAAVFALSPHPLLLAEAAILFRERFKFLVCLN